VRSTKKHEALERIRDLITSGQYQQGQLFSENSLVTALGVSRSPIRDALAALVAEGIVEQIPQVGAKVRVFSDRDLRNIFRIRERLEPLAIEDLVNNESARLSAIPLLGKLVDGMEAAADKGDVQNFLRHDVEFHWQTAEVCDNPELSQVIRHIGHKIRIIGFMSTPDPKSMKVVVQEHRAIVAAVRKGDVNEAITRTKAHISLTEQRLSAARGKELFTEE